MRWSQSGRVEDDWFGSNKAPHRRCDSSRDKNAAAQSGSSGSRNFGVAIDARGNSKAARAANATCATQSCASRGADLDMLVECTSARNKTVVAGQMQTFLRRCRLTGRAAAVHAAKVMQTQMQSARALASRCQRAHSYRALHSAASPAAPPARPLRFPISPDVSWLQQASSVWVQEVEWGSQDTFQHVNNVVYHRWFENGRFDWFTQLRGSVRALFGAEADRIAGRFLSTRAVGPILKAAEIKFRFPVSHPDRIHVATRLKPDSLLADRFTLEHMVVSERHQRIAAEGTGTIVAFDYAVTKSKTALPAQIAEAIRALEARV